MCSSQRRKPGREAKVCAISSAAAKAPARRVGRIRPGCRALELNGKKQLQKHLKSRESLRVLDIGPTSSTNINYVTSLGHSIYMANLVEEAAKPEWSTPGEGGGGRDATLIDFSPRI